MSEWLDLGLPLANRAGYAYVKDMRLIRSPIASPLPEQRQQSNPGKKTFDLSWNLTPEQLNVATLYLLEKGFKWFQLELVSEVGFELHEIRLLDKFETRPIAGQYYKLSFKAETKIDRAICVMAVCDVDLPEDDSPCGPLPGTVQVTVRDHLAICGKVVEVAIINDAYITLKDNLTICGKVAESKLHRNVVILPTSLYPLEIEDTFTSRGILVEGWQYAVQVEGFSASVSLIEGEKVPIYVDVFHTQYPEAFSASVSLISGEKVWIYSDVFHDQYPESFSASVALISGEKVGIDIQTTMPPDKITSTGWLTDGEFTE